MRQKSRIYQRSQAPIDLLVDDVKAVQAALYRAGPTARKLAAADCGQMITKKKNSTATTKWAAPTMLASRKNSSLRFCVNHRKLNAVTIRDSYQFSRMDEGVDSLEQTTVFSESVTSSGSWKIEIDEQNCNKRAFTSQHRL